MGWSVGEDKDGRDIGYGVPAFCDHPECSEKIHRGLAFVCGMINTPGEDRGCGLHFCTSHLRYSPKYGQLCERCYPRRQEPWCRKPDHPEWIEHKLTDPTWGPWRAENSAEVTKLRANIKD